MKKVIRRELTRQTNQDHGSDGSDDPPITSRHHFKKILAVSGNGVCEGVGVWCGTSVEVPKRPERMLGPPQLQ